MTSCALLDYFPTFHPHPDLFEVDLAVAVLQVSNFEIE